nr:immunoglobulin light chain junction region [Macaca mulatta]MOV73575.1 immunoglobulin light chain junction region [Macaca mulatta]MOV94313.1 immunoglobulin light chain junction region [Macaca mulatta]MOV94599.1 immunoglobulin light chain junction region [Macaca mulatta]MOV94784.1 immunoglobulin light chain junction region [Macaca mulatta]
DYYCQVWDSNSDVLF